MFSHISGYYKCVKMHHTAWIQLKLLHLLVTASMVVIFCFWYYYGPVIYGLDLFCMLWTARLCYDVRIMCYVTYRSCISYSHLMLYFLIQTKHIPPFFRPWSFSDLSAASNTESNFIIVAPEPIFFIFHKGWHYLQGSGSKQYSKSNIGIHAILWEI